MFTIEGKANTAKVFTEVIDEGAVRQIKELCDQDWAAGSQIRIMPDVHAGAGCTIGTTMTITDKAVPNLVGVDIGCGMETVRLKETHIELQKLDKLIYERIPSGFDIRDTPHRFAERIDLTELFCYDEINPLRAERSIGTLGGGSVNTKIKNAEIVIDSEGDEVTGIGDTRGSGNVAIIDSSINMKMLAANPKDIATGTGDVQIQNSTINSLVNNKRIEHN